MAKSSVSIERRMLKRRYKMGGGYTIFYGVLLAGISIAFSFFLAGSAGLWEFAMPAYLYNSVTGALYVYNAMALPLIWLSAFLAPRPYQFSELNNNSWNMLYKFGVKPGALAFSKVRVALMSPLVTYLVGFMVAALVGYIKASDRSVDVRLALSLLAVGVFSVLILCMPALAVGALTRGKTMLRLTFLLTGAGLGYLLYFNGYHHCASIEEISASTGRLISVSPLGLVLIALVFSILFPIIAISRASSRAKAYNIEDIDNDMLRRMGIADNILILQPGHSKYQVVLSGADVNDSDLQISIPPLELEEDEPQAEDEDDGDTAPRRGSARKQKRRRGRRRRDEDEDDEDYDEDEEDDE